MCVTLPIFLNFLGAQFTEPPGVPLSIQDVVLYSLFQITYKIIRDHGSDIDTIAYGTGLETAHVSACC